MQPTTTPADRVGRHDGRLLPGSPRRVVLMPAPVVPIEWTRTHAVPRKEPYVTAERRQHPRIVKLFEGRWQGASGSGECRIADLGVGGCFIQTLAMPAAGEQTTVTIRIGGSELSVPGRILYVERGMGFAVQFVGMSDADLTEFSRVLEALQAPA